MTISGKALVVLDAILVKCPHLLSFTHDGVSTQTLQTPEAIKLFSVIMAALEVFEGGGLQKQA